MIGPKRKMIGIDFGSSQSSVAIMEIGVDTDPVLYHFEECEVGEPLPTVLLMNGDDAPIAIGKKVAEHLRDGESACIVKPVYNFKRELWDRDAKGNYTEKAKKALHYTELFLKEIARQIRDDEKQELTPKRYSTCIAYPVEWEKDGQNIETLKNIVEKAGFPSHRTRGIYAIPEPYAAILAAHNLEDADHKTRFHWGNKPETSFVVDFGAGTLDVCVVETDIGGKDPEVKGKCGIKLGGYDFDKCLIEHLELVYKDRNISYDSLAAVDKFKLDVEIRKAKESLSLNFSEGNVKPTALVRWPSCGELKLTLTELDIKNLVKEKGIEDKIRSCIREAVSHSGVPEYEITRAVLTGGSSQWFFVKGIIADECRLTEENIIISGSPFADVAFGCALRGRIDERHGRLGLWVRFRLNGRPLEGGYIGRNLLKAGRTEPEKDVCCQDLGSIKGTQLINPHRLDLYFEEGEDVYMLKPYRGGKHAVVDFYARANFKHRKHLDFKNDEYSCCLLCKEEESGYEFKLEIKDWALMNDKEHPHLDWDDPRLIDIELGKHSRRGWFGFGTRKSVLLENATLNDTKEK